MSSIAAELGTGTEILVISAESCEQNIECDTTPNVGWCLVSYPMASIESGGRPVAGNAASAGLSAGFAVFALLQASEQNLTLEPAFKGVRHTMHLSGTFSEA